ncbi:MAG: GNAT family N-acetyltransferase [Armatimonadota bacterium]
MSLDNSGTTIECLRTPGELRALREEWGALYARSAPRNPFLSFDWTEICWEQLCAGCEPYVLTARRGGELVGVAPLRRERQLGFRVLRFIGDGRSDYLGFLFAADCPEAERLLLDELQRRRGEWDLAVLRQLGDGYSELTRVPAPKGLRSAGVEGTTAPYTAMDADWTALCARGPGWLKRMQKAGRKWLKEGGTVERYVGAEAAARVEEVAAIEARSWKGREGVARFQPGEGQELLRRALLALGGGEEMELWIARMDGQPVAFEINFLTPERIWLYQGAYDEDYRKFSPGGVLDCLSIQRAWESGRREYDFMSGDEVYKAERTMFTRAIRYLALYPPTLSGMLAFVLLVAPRWRLKSYAFARAALQLWVTRKSKPAALLPLGVAERLRGHRAPAVRESMP